MDQALFHLINERWTHPILDLFMAAISHIDIWKPLFVLVAAALLIWGGFHGRAFVICVVLSLLIAEHVTGTLKRVIDRPRPKQAQRVRMVDLQRANFEFLRMFKKPTIRYSGRRDKNRSGPSFPSGHTTDNTVIAMCCTLFYRRRGWVYWIIAAAVGYSRVYLGAHWPSDVIATVFLAGGETLIIIAALEALWRFIGPRQFSNVYERHPSLVFENRHPAGSADPSRQP